jgi:hypothetical protein
MASLVRQRARLAAQLQYAPQQQALGLLLQQAYSDYGSGVAASRSAARGVARSARSAVAPTRGAYQASARQADRAQSSLSQQLGALGHAADPYKASASGEMALQDQLRARAQADATTELRQRAVEARQGAAYDARALRGQLQDSVLRIAQQQQLLAGEQGATQSKLFMDLLDQAHRDKLAQGSLTERVRHDRATEQNAARNRGPGGARLLPQSQQNAVFDKIDAAVPLIAQLEGAGLRSHEIRSILLNGHRTPVQTVYDPATGRPVIDTRTGLRKTTGGSEIPAFRSKTVVNAAYDLYALRYLSEANIRALHRAGILIRGRYRLEPKGGAPRGVGKAVQRVGRAFRGF